MTKTVGFPFLGIEFDLNPVAFSVFGYDIKWYALIIVTGLLAGTLFAIYEGRRVGVKSDYLLDILLIGAPCAVVFARAYYVVFKWDYYSEHLDEIVKIWNGGIAIYGALIGAVLSAVLYCLARRLDIWKVFDVCVFGLLIGQIIGRWGNFVNVEAYGSETSVFWAMNIASTNSNVHPTFLYESLWNLALFVALFAFRKHKKFEGELFLWYIVGYGFGRALIEGLRADSLYIGYTGIRVSQLLAVLTVIAGCIVIAYKYIRLYKKAR